MLLGQMDEDDARENALEAIRDFIAEARESGLWHSEEVAKMTSLVSYGYKESEDLEHHRKILEMRTEQIGPYAEIMRKHHPKLWHFLLETQTNLTLQLEAKRSKVNRALPKSLQDEIGRSTERTYRNASATTATSSITAGGFGSGLKSMPRRPLGGGVS